MKAAAYALWCFLCLLGYILWESALALLALLWTALRWPFAQAHRAWRKLDTCQRCHAHPCYLFGQCRHCVTAALHDQDPPKP